MTNQIRPMTKGEKDRARIRDKLNQVWYEEKTCIVCGVVIPEGNLCESCLEKEI